LEYRVKKKVTNPDNVNDSAIDDNEKAGVEVCVDAEKTVRMRLLRKPWKTERRRT
jgi:hypothetical protein